MPASNPTRTTYEALNQAYDFFNDRLFSGGLPACLITMQRKARAYGYFAGSRFGGRDGGEVTDEIALNPSHFKARTDRESLSTLAHEMAHLWQHHFGKPSRSGYHNKEWAAKMHEIGLHPSTTGEPGGKETGQSCSHYIIEGGAFARAYDDLAGNGMATLYVELWDDEEAKKKRKAKAASKTKYTCPGCQANAWAKPDTRLICGECEVLMLADEEEKEEAL
ncbi:SprT-like domain-containing protein [Allomesorhizobium camelthorni]|uniref:SprT family zinc-dependent metalloprotease n=1 Tax=Allomesorhizobium camelthorni TaxID=475069 RepID=A0A6G4WNA8_9HYPH|nr:SprT-like domain-containing protein [Mesorhizobium camelthorni]NGO55683.1 SprT family zinc-dependent metalloprotease [Mesorhizobium camelthorni]